MIKNIIIILLFIIISPLYALDKQQALNILLYDYNYQRYPTARVLYIWTPEETYTAVNGFIDKKTKQHASIENQFRIASISKTYLSVLLLKLVESEHIRLDHPIYYYLPANIIYNLPNGHLVTIKQLLNMTSGIPDYFNDDFYEVILKDPLHIWTPTQVLEQFVYNTNALFPPGKDYNYSNTNYLILQLILETILQKSLAEIMREQIFQPLLLNDTYTEVFEKPRGKGLVHGYEDLDGDGFAEDIFGINDGAGMGDGGLITNAKDLAKFYQALFIDKVLLKPISLDKMLQDENNFEYGLGIEVFYDETWGFTIGHSGAVSGFSSYIMYIPFYQVIIIALQADTNLEEDILYEVLEIIFPH